MGLDDLPLRCPWALREDFSSIPNEKRSGILLGGDGREGGVSYCMNLPKVSYLERRSLAPFPLFLLPLWLFTSFCSKTQLIPFWEWPLFLKWGILKTTPMPPTFPASGFEWPSLFPSCQLSLLQRGKASFPGGFSFEWGTIMNFLLQYFKWV